MSQVKRLLAWGDSSVAGTGFGTVSKYILGALHATGKYEIHHLAINFHGDFVDRSLVPWQVQPARLLDPKDPHGMKMFLRTLMKNNYDIVWVLNDLYVTHQVTELVEKAKQKMAVKGRKLPTIVYYYPVDCQVPDDGNSFVRLADIPVCYNDYGKEETLKTLPEVKDKLKQIPHGVDTSAFYPVPKQQSDMWKQQILNISPETTLVVNVNRNSSRKQIQYSMLAFKEFRKHVPDSVMYLHTAIKDQGGDLTRVIKDLQLDPTKDICFPLNFSPANPVPVKTLNAIYNMADIFLTTHLGEGHGLTIHEAMAAGTPVVAPNNTSTPFLLGKNSTRGYIYPCKDTIYIDNSGPRKKGLIPDIVKQMLKVYSDGPKQENKKVQAAVDWAKKTDWSIQTKKWIKLFNEIDEIRDNTEDNNVNIEEL